MLRQALTRLAQVFRTPDQRQLDLAVPQLPLFCKDPLDHFPHKRREVSIPKPLRSRLLGKELWLVLDPLRTGSLRQQL